MLISTLSPAEVLALTELTAGPIADPATVLLAYVYLYDQRGGGVETSFKGDQQGLGSTTRNKKRFEARAYGDVVGDFGPQCGGLGSTLSDGARCLLQTAALWHQAHGA
jgi:hypothetical protein